MAAGNLLRIERSRLLVSQSAFAWLSSRRHVPLTVTRQLLYSRRWLSNQANANESSEGFMSRIFGFLWKPKSSDNTTTTPASSEKQEVPPQTTPNNTSSLLDQEEMPDRQLTFEEYLEILKKDYTGGSLAQSLIGAVSGVTNSAAGVQNLKEVREAATKMFAIMTPNERATPLSLTPVQYTRISQASGLSAEAMSKVLNMYVSAASMYDELRHLKKTGGPMPKTPQQFSTFLANAASRAKLMVKAQASTGVKQKKISGNDLCPCGSGKKYKRCCKP